MDIPHRIPSATEALAAIDGYLSWRKPESLELATGYAPWSVQRVNGQRQYLAAQLAALATDPGPGPGVQVETPGSATRTVGKPLAGRPFVTLSRPERGAYGVVIDDALAQLAEVATGVTILRALSARAASCAVTDRDNNRHRTAERLEQESTALAAYAYDLEREYVEPIGDVFLGQWRAEAARRAPLRRTGAPVRNVNLR